MAKAHVTFCAVPISHAFLECSLALRQRVEDVTRRRSQALARAAVQVRRLVDEEVAKGDRLR